MGKRKVRRMTEAGKVWEGMKIDCRDERKEGTSVR